jgi:hypothetical protein
MNTELVRLINGALLNVNKAIEKLDDTAYIPAADNEILDYAYNLLDKVSGLLRDELKELEE